MSEWVSSWTLRNQLTGGAYPFLSIDSPIKEDEQTYGTSALAHLSDFYFQQELLDLLLFIAIVFKVS
jgi:hypothetical protein